MGVLFFSLFYFFLRSCSFLFSFVSFFFPLSSFFFYFLFSSSHFFLSLFPFWPKIHALFTSPFAENSPQSFYTSTSCSFLLFPPFGQTLMELVFLLLFFVLAVSFSALVSLHNWS